MNYKLESFMKSLVDVVLAIAMTLLGLRFVLKLFGANASNDFVSWIYDTSAEILAPFSGMFESVAREGFVIEFSTLFAMLVYGLVGMLAYYLIDVLTPSTKASRSKK